MKIKKGVWRRNRTSKYLMPILVQYYDDNPKLMKLFNDAFKVSFGVKDYNTEIEKPCLYVLVDLTSTDNMKELIRFLDKNKICVTHYPYYRNGKSNEFYMFVFKVQDKFIKSYEHFLKGEYSLMYPDKKMQDYYFKDTNTLNVFNKRKKALIKGRRIFRRFFKMVTNPVSLKEYDLPPIISEETFNKKKELTNHFFKTYK